jgi:peptidoglycan/xylan/chitin deacetylase (PgdA/CDA1 family)
MKYGSHSNTHPHVNNLSYEQNVEELNKCNEKIEKITGKKTNLYRTPYGEYNNTVIQSAEDNGYYSIQWNIDTLDYNGLTGEEMWNRIKNKLSNGSIILSHNGTDNTANSLDMLIKNIKSKGFEIVKVSDLIYQDNYDIDNNGTQQLKKQE